MTNAPLNPAGEFQLISAFDDQLKQQLVQELGEAPKKLRQMVEALSTEQLDTKYRNWTARQIVHHIADSHVNSYIRFKWALTEPTPTIKAYNEADWVALDDCVKGDIEPALRLLEGVHAKWVQLLKTMSVEQFECDFVHPQSGETMTLWQALQYYPWHSRHHTAQIEWLLQHQ